MTTHIMDNALFLLAKPEYKNAKPGTMIQIIELAMVNNNTKLSLYSLSSAKSFLLLSIGDVNEANLANNI